MLGYVLDELFIHHHAPSGHPERPARIAAVRDAVAATDLATRARHVPIRAATDEELGRVHGADYLASLARTLPGASGWLDGDTYYSPRTWDAALAAAGSVAELAIQVMAGTLSAGYALVRPPGHHAERDRAMGFCLLNNVAVAAAAARAAGAARVAILDWDVHHGNGTQQIFWDDPTVMYQSIHQFPFYPGTGAPDEIGGPAARGATVNVGLPAGGDDRDYLAAYDHVLGPALAAFRPDLILVSAGFDAHQADPLAGMKVSRYGFARLAARVRTAADALCGGRWVVALEGGYDLDGLSEGATATLAAMLAPADGLASTAPIELADASPGAQRAIAESLRARTGLAVEAP
ncbi:MAG: histone deacetylase [Myxococcales bacterium]|nr:histone deacetylase [Myxococcales bacterium]